MPRSIQIEVREGETLESVVRRFKSKAQQEGILTEIKRHSFSSKPGETAAAAKPALAQKRTRKKSSDLLTVAIEKITSLPARRQDAIAGSILADLQEQPDPTVARFGELIDAKYTRGLTPAEKAEVETIEASFRVSDELFYRPIIDRVKKKIADQKRGQS